MEKNSPGKVRRDRSRSRGRASLSSRVNFFEQVWTSGSPSTTDEASVHVLGQSGVDELERAMTERRRRDQEQTESPVSKHVVTLKKVVSPGRSPATEQYTNEVFVTSWTDRVQSPPPSSEVVHPPWRLARRSEPSEIPSSISAPTPASALTKYQEWRARKLSSATTDSSVDIPWRRKRNPSELSIESDKSVSSSGSSARTSTTQQPQWYSEFRTASMTQVAKRLESYQTGLNTHYDFHIAEIKGIAHGILPKENPRARQSSHYQLTRSLYNFN